MLRTATLSFAFAACIAADAAFAQQGPEPQPTPRPQSMAPQAKPSAQELAFRHQLMLDDYARVEYRDEDGKAIGFEDILRAIPTGKSFSIEKDSEHALATVKLGGGKPEAAGEPAPSALQPGRSLPVPEGLRTLDGQAFGSAELHGRRTLLSLYFAECLPCIAEVPELNALADAHPEMGVYALTFDDAETARQFVKQRGLRLPVVADAQSWLDQIGVRTYPTLVLVDEQGRVAAVRHGGAMGPGGSPADGGIAQWMADAVAPAAGAP